jgi:hypothetical protein
MTELFPSILPSQDSYSSQELQEWDWISELRPIAAELETDEISGRSTQLEVCHYLAGRYSKQTLDLMREEVNTDDPDFAQIKDELQTLGAYSNGSDS